ncbi:MAG TPA: hypothetical protein VFC92_02800 [Bacteroidales bacterium]|nr:hypothetical protein [Bacteroidales bacterium]
MKLDINKVINDMLAGVKDTVADSWDEVKCVAEEFILRRKDRLFLLAELRISGDLPEDKFKSRIDDEKLILEAELNAMAVITKAIAQRAANAAIDILEQAVKAAISIV